MRLILRLLGTAALSSLIATPCLAVEGGLGAYLLGSRDSFAGIMPGPGFYAGTDLVHSNGSVQGIAMAGVPIRADADLSLTFVKFSFTKAFDATLWGGTPGINLNVPVVTRASLSFIGETPPIVGVPITDTTSGIGDSTITPMVGWHKGNFHHSIAFSVFVPTGSYQTATLDLASRTLSALNTGKNIWSFQPVYSATWFNPDSGWEYSGATSILWSTRNKATDYQNASTLNLEGAVMKHAKNGWAYGLTAYAYQQFADDTGSGAESTKTLLGASTLQARVLGLGPMITYSSFDMFGKKASFKLKYYAEFGAKRRFESNTIWANLSLTF